LFDAVNEVGTSKNFTQSGIFYVKIGNGAALQTKDANKG
jgi:hypothetical protein